MIVIDLRTHHQRSTTASKASSQQRRRLFSAAFAVGSETAVGQAILAATLSGVADEPTKM
jgi:hypothetical protein